MKIGVKEYERMLAGVLVPQAIKQPTHLGILLTAEIALLFEAQWGGALSGALAPFISLRPEDRRVCTGQIAVAQLSAGGNAVLLATKGIVLDVAHNSASSSSDSRGEGLGFANSTSGLPFGTNNSRSEGSGQGDPITGTQLSVGGVRMATTEGNIHSRSMFLFEESSRGQGAELESSMLNTLRE